MHSFLVYLKIRQVMHIFPVDNPFLLNIMEVVLSVVFLLIQKT